MSAMEELLNELQSVEGHVDEASAALAAAYDRADAALAMYAALGGASARAQAVLDIVEKVAGQVRLVPDELREIGDILRGIVPGLTPQESIDKLDTAIDRMTTTGESIGGKIDSVDRAITETHSHLEGSEAAEEIATLLQQAKDHLDEAQNAVGGTKRSADAKREAFRGN